MSTLVILLGMAVGAAALHPTLAHGQSWLAAQATASCAQLARLDPTATNGSAWGTSLLPGHNAPGGWFGVDVCANGVNAAAPGGANLSCDHVPANLAQTGCAPGHATADGFGLTFQCVELVARFAAWAYGDSPSDWLGDAPDLWLSGNHPRDFSAIPQGGTHAPVPGDVLVWGTVDAQGHPMPSTGDGHVAVVAAVHGDQLTFVEENALAGNRNIPEETTTLQHSGRAWTVGTADATESGARALYGWLHSSRNTGTWPSPHTSLPATATPATPTPARADASRELPPVPGAAVVTTLGTLADLTWTTATSPLPTTSLSPTSSTSNAPVGPPHMVARSLGAPPNTTLAPGQTPAVIVDPSGSSAGSRIIIAFGADGQVYAATTAPGLFGVLWQTLGGPPDRLLTGSPSAAAYSGGLAVAALDANGQAWWRGGPTRNLSDLASWQSWQSLGAPAGASLTALWLAAAPGSGAPLAVGLGNDGHLYTIRATAGSPQGQGTPSGWSAWSPIALPALPAQLVGPLLGLSEEPQAAVSSSDPNGAANGAANGSSTWSNAPLDLLVGDTQGGIILAHLTPSAGWHVQALKGTPSFASLLAATAVTTAADTGGTASSAQVQVYIQSAAGLSLGTVTLDPHTSAAAAQWQALPSAGAAGDSAAALSARAVPFGDDLSLLVLPVGSSLSLAGTDDALSTAEPPSANASVAATPGLATAGSVAGAQSFADHFTAPILAAEWVATGAGPAPAAGQVTLPTAGSPGQTLLLQEAPSGDAAIQTTVQLPSGAAATLHAGLVLATDPANWLTLALAGNRQVALCAEAWGAQPTCQHATLTPQQTSQPIALRLTRRGDTYSAAFDANDQGWTTLATWTATLPTGVTPVLTNADTSIAVSRHAGGKQSAPAAAPLAFTSAGLFAAQDGTTVTPSTTTASGPQFSYYSVVPSQP